MPSNAVLDADLRCLCPSGDSAPLVRLAESRRVERVGEATDTSEVELEAMERFLDWRARYFWSCFEVKGQLSRFFARRRSRAFLELCSGEEGEAGAKTRTFFLAAMSRSARSRAAASFPAAN